MIVLASRFAPLFCLVLAPSWTINHAVYLDARYAALRLFTFLVRLCFASGLIPRSDHRCYL